MKAAHEMGAEVIEHWYSLVPSQHFSTQEFYGHIQGLLEDQKVPALAASRVDLAEGGALSDKREYLRLKRERLTFDVCGAPVGVNYFFSYRFYVEPAVVRVWQILALLFALGFLAYAAMRFIGPFAGPFLLLVACIVLAWLMRNAIGMGLRDLDTTLLNLPALGPVYERWFRKDSYYRQDMRIAYCSIVSAVVKQEVARITGEKGVKLLREFTYSPRLGDIYRMEETDVSPDSGREPAGA
jgi:hypothetical protein